MTLLCSSVTAQDIKNTLGANGNFVVEDENNVSLLNVSSLDGSITSSNLAGTGNNYLSVDSSGNFIRSSGSLELSVNVISSSTYSALSSDYTLITLTDTTITMPDAANSIGRVLVIKNPQNQSIVNITSTDPNDRFDGALGVQLNNSWEFVIIQAVTTQAWVIIGGNGYVLTN
ncbi:hypothetical protein KFZ70_05990 [Tamlana fucoidanivorans]|uniref:Uncharacterized protein n=1 Tax=Allotamlana fucoidanivorans TaxID=2583814 RepID=A0A5C4SBK0_9FLAO|nr:hypothetical protein [Tamlana fucoidanivorans]TNJ40845.1 hypothetical protein FGF67_16750 [Tamlana fucoidanivorans]